MLIRNVRLWPSRDRLAGTVPPANIPVTDVRITGGTITEVAPGLGPSPGGGCSLGGDCSPGGGFSGGGGSPNG
jgi:uncharacterized membrane protein YgcG